MDEIISVFSELSYINKKIVLLEIMGLAYSDGLYDDTERKFIVENIQKIGLSQSGVEDVLDAVKEYLDVLKKLQK